MIRSVKYLRRCYLKIYINLSCQAFCLGLDENKRVNINKLIPTFYTASMDLRVSNFYIE